MAEPLEAPNLPPEVVPVDDEFSRLPPDERARRRRAWLDSLHTAGEPFDLGMPASELLAEARREEGWD